MVLIRIMGVSLIDNKGIDSLTRAQNGFLEPRKASSSGLTFSDSKLFPDGFHIYDLHRFTCLIDGQADEGRDESFFTGCLWRRVVRHGSCQVVNNEIITSSVRVRVGNVNDVNGLVWADKLIRNLRGDQVRLQGTFETANEDSSLRPSGACVGVE